MRSHKAANVIARAGKHVHTRRRTHPHKAVNVSARGGKRVLVRYTLHLSGAVFSDGSHSQNFKTQIP